MSIDRILLVRLSALGDCLAAIPVFQALREQFPHAHLAWAIQDNFAPLIRNLPGLDELFVFPRMRWRTLESPLYRWKEAYRFIRRLRRRRFQVTVDVQSNTKSSAIAFFTRAPLRIGHGKGESREISRLFTNCPVAPRHEHPHILQRNLNLLSPLGIHDRDPQFSLPIDTVASRQMTDWLQSRNIEKDRFVLLVPFCGNTYKEWPAAHFTALASLLIAADIPVIFLCGPGKETDTAVMLPSPPSPHVALAPRTSIPQMVELIRMAQIVIGGDTGPVQIAGALGIRTAALFGPTDPIRSHPWGPYTLHHLDDTPLQVFQTICQYF